MAYPDYGSITIRGAPENKSQERLARYSQAPDHRVYRGVGLGQVLAGFQHHRGRKPKADQRNLSGSCNNSCPITASLTPMY